MEKDYEKEFSNVWFQFIKDNMNSSNPKPWDWFLISEKNRDQVLVPPGFANGHYALTDCVFHYNMFYKGEYVDSINHGVAKWNDPKWNIEWPSNNPILQMKDK
jgi:dTDP-4-dehydrorhamnose 3,5-epimerase